ncbi:MAG: T9SS type A sorting domain-containing protein, partial [Bacteroidota bacterium]
LSFAIETSSEQASQLRIYDLQGKLLLSQIYKEQEWTLKTEGLLAPGLYWVELRQGDMSINRLIQKLP